MHVYKAYNGPMATTGAQAGVSTGTVIKTMLQIATPASRMLKVLEWGYNIDAGPATGSLKVELLETDVAATVTAHVASGVQPQFPGLPASLMTLGTSATGYTASAEGAITTTRQLDVVTIGPNTPAAATLNYNKVWIPDARPVVNVSKFLRVRATFATSVNMVCWVVWDE